MLSTPLRSTLALGATAFVLAGAANADLEFGIPYASLESIGGFTPTVSVHYQHTFSQTATTIMHSADGYEVSYGRPSSAAATSTAAPLWAEWPSDPAPSIDTEPDDWPLAWGDFNVEQAVRWRPGWERPRKDTVHFGDPDWARSHGHEPVIVDSYEASFDHVPENAYGRNRPPRRKGTDISLGGRHRKGASNTRNGVNSGYIDGDKINDFGFDDEWSGPTDIEDVDGWATQEGGGKSGDTEYGWTGSGSFTGTGIGAAKKAINKAKKIYNHFFGKKESKRSLVYDEPASHIVEVAATPDSVNVTPTQVAEVAEVAEVAKTVEAADAPKVAEIVNAADAPAYQLPPPCTATVTTVWTITTFGSNAGEVTKTVGIADAPAVAETAPITHAPDAAALSAAQHGGLCPSTVTTTATIIILKPFKGDAAEVADVAEATEAGQRPAFSSVTPTPSPHSGTLVVTTSTMHEAARTTEAAEVADVTDVVEVAEIPKISDSVDTADAPIGYPPLCTVTTFTTETITVYGLTDNAETKAEEASEVPAVVEAAETTDAVSFPPGHSPCLSTTTVAETIITVKNVHLLPTRAADAANITDVANTAEATEVAETLVLPGRISTSTTTASFSSKGHQMEGEPTAAPLVRRDDDDTLGYTPFDYQYTDTFSTTWAQTLKTVYTHKDHYVHEDNDQAREHFIDADRHVADAEHDFVDSYGDSETGDQLRAMEADLDDMEERARRGEVPFDDDWFKDGFVDRIVNRKYSARAAAGRRTRDRTDADADKTAAS